MQAVVRQLAGRDVVTDLAVACALHQQGCDEVAEVLVRSSAVLTSMQQCRELRAVVLVGDERIGLEDGREASGGGAATERGRRRAWTMTALPTASRKAASEKRSVVKRASALPPLVASSGGMSPA